MFYTQSLDTGLVKYVMNFFSYVVCYLHIGLTKQKEDANRLIVLLFY